MTHAKPVLRTVAIAAAALFAVGTPIVQALTGTIAVADSDFIREGESTLRAAGYAFSIWTLIYAGLLCRYTGWRLLMLRVIEPSDPAPWASITEEMRRQARDTAESMTQRFAAEAWAELARDRALSAIWRAWLRLMFVSESARF